MTLVKALSLFLGLMSVAFGALKFVDPFKGWYSVQIASSGLPEPAFALGIGAELLTGLLFLLPFLVALNDRKKLLLLTLANTSLILVLAVATVVHLNPDVPADVLPLTIKPPVIPLFFVGMAILNQVLLRKKRSIPASVSP